MRVQTLPSAIPLFFRSFLLYDLFLFLLFSICAWLFQGGTRSTRFVFFLFPFLSRRFSLFLSSRSEAAGNTRDVTPSAEPERGRGGGRFLAGTRLSNRRCRYLFPTIVQRTICRRKQMRYSGVLCGSLSYSCNANRHRAAA